MKDEENEKEMETKEKKPMSMKKKWAVLVAMAVVFGLIAGGVMYGVNAAGNRLYAQNHISNTDTLSDTKKDSSDSTGDSSASVEEVTKNAMPSLVTISTMSVEEMRNFFGGTQKYEVEGAGTGVIVGKNDSELLIATNNHVVEGASSLSVGFIDESTAEGSVKGTDADNDLAVVSVKLSDIPDDTMKQMPMVTESVIITRTDPASTQMQTATESAITTRTDPVSTQIQTVTGSVIIIRRRFPPAWQPGVIMEPAITEDGETAIIKEGWKKRCEVRKKPEGPLICTGTQ